MLTTDWCIIQDLHVHEAIQLTMIDVCHVNQFFNGMKFTESVLMHVFHMQLEELIKDHWSKGVLLKKKL